MSGVIVTGGASGIGRASAEALVDDGRSVALWDLNPDAVGVAEAIGADAPAGVVVTGAALDVTDQSAVGDAVAAAADALGGIDGVVHAAGTVSVDPIGDLTPETWAKVVDVNLTCFPFIVQAALEHLRSASNPAVVAISSIEGLVGNGAIPAYCASKHGLIGTVRSMAHQLGPDAIRVNAVCPGFVVTPLLQIALDVPGLREEMEAEAPLGRLAEPVDIANAVAFLMSPKAAFITGVALPVDGGATAIL